MNGEHDVADDNRHGALWSQHINAQHGFQDWTLGELYGISNFSRETQTATYKDCLALLPDTASAKKEFGSGKHDALLPPAHEHNVNLSTKLLATLSAVAGSPAAGTDGTSTLAPDERVRLTPEQAIIIYQLKTTKTQSPAARLAVEYGITSKAIRDIWTRRSWAESTQPYWSD